MNRTDKDMDNKWDMLESSNEDREKIWAKNRTFAGDVWFRFRHKPTAIAGLIIIVVLILFALVGPMFTSYSYSAQNLDVVNIPPRMKVFETPDGDGYLYITQALKILHVNADGTLGEWITDTVLYEGTLRIDEPQWFSLTIPEKTAKLCLFMKRPWDESWFTWPITDQDPFFVSGDTFLTEAE